MHSPAVCGKHYSCESHFAISRALQADLPATTNTNLLNNYLGWVKTGYSNRNTTDKVDYTLNERHQFSGLFSTGKRSQSTPYRGNTLPLPYAVTRWVEEVPTTTSIKHTWVFSPTLLSQDLSVRREIPITERWRVSLQADAINAFNVTYFGAIAVDISSANFGRVSSQLNSPRTV